MGKLEFDIKALQLHHKGCCYVVKPFSNTYNIYKGNRNA